MKCCNTEIPIKQGTQNGKKLYYLTCESCGKKGKGATEKEAIDNFNKSKPESGLNTPENKSLILAPLPSKKTELVKWSNDNLPALLNQSAQFIDKPATKRLIEKNVRYVMNLSGSAIDKIWSTPEGQESLSHALTESLYYAATMPDMGSIVPFGKVAEFIPSVECYEFALCQGKNAPFKEINIFSIYENDQTKISQEDGNFKININIGIPRGEIIAVAVTAVRSDNDKSIGNVYDVDRLIKKAEQHSPSYRLYLDERREFTLLKSEGKTKTDGDGNHYYVKSIKKSDGGTWDKKIYENDIKNPYEGADRPEMLRKSAGKSFFRPYMKTRNAAAMAEEWEDEDDIQDGITREKAATSVLKASGRQFEDVKDISTVNIKDAEIIPENNTENNKTQEGKNNVKDDKKDSNIGDL